MAAAETSFVFNIAQKVLEKLVSLAFQEAHLIWGAESDLGRLERTLSTVKVVLLDAEDQHYEDKWWKYRGAPPGRYAVSFLPLIHLYSEPRWRQNLPNSENSEKF